MARTHYYVDPVNGSDATGDGTSGTPWASLQHALDTITRNASDGDQINLRDSGPDVLAASLDQSTYGTPNAVAPLVIRGYTATENDGGVGVIAVGGAYPGTVSDQWNDTIFIDLEVQSYAGHWALNLWGNNTLYRVHITGAGPGVYLRNAGTVRQCRFTNAQGPCLYIHAGTMGSEVIYNWFEEPSLDAWNGWFPGHEPYALLFNSTTDHSLVLGNLIIRNSTWGAGIRILAGQITVMHSVIHNRGDSGGQGIEMLSLSGTDGRLPTVMNNIISGMNGVGGVGIQTSGNHAITPMQVQNNAFWNNTTDIEYAFNDPIIEEDNISLTENPYVDAPAGNFNLTEDAQQILAGAGFPVSWLGETMEAGLSIGPQQGVEVAAPEPALFLMAEQEDQIIVLNWEFTGGETESETETASVQTFDAQEEQIAHLYDPSHKVLSSYDGPLVRVHRNIDDAEKEFGVAPGTNRLDLDAVEEWLAGDGGYIAAVHDQKGGKSLTRHQLKEDFGEALPPLELLFE